MKLLMENWREFLNEEDEEQLEEGWKERIAGLAAVGALGSMPDMAQARPFSKDKSPETTQQAEVGSQVGYSEDGSMHKFGVKIDDAGNDTLQQMAIDDALSGLEAKGVNTSGGYRLLRTGFSDGILVIGIPK
tara:strand:+ start:532 stop:927 length:396 start_codon:yes stop_codon:yes gene_type:complete